jgi:FMN phosphatase YigB (HAD superfamily)
LVSVPADLSGERRAVSAATAPARTQVTAITFDFANTLVPVDRRAFRAVVAHTASAVADACRIDDQAAFLAAWDEERDRQFREDVPAGREVDLVQRVARVLARLRGLPPPPLDGRWDDAAALARSTVSERDLIVEHYTGSFIHAMPPPSGVSPLLTRLAGRGLRLGIVSNWPLAATIDRYVAAAGWAPLLQAVVVSQRVGAIKPQLAIFAAAQRELGVPGSGILHVGDDWMADIVGAKRAGWLACFLRDQPQDWPRQPVEAADDVRADLEIRHLAQLEAALDRLLVQRAAGGGPARASRRLP